MANTIKIITIFLIYYFQLCLTEQLECYNCTSSTEINCAINPNELLSKKTCGKMVTECYVAIDNKQYTIRGCKTPKMRLPKLSETCNSNLCNVNIYPEDRLKCFKCNGKDCVSQPEGNPEICGKHNAEDVCYTNVIDELDAYRGCLSDRDPTIPIDYQKTCKGNGCNNENGILNTICSQCDSKSDNDCIRNVASPCTILNKKTCKVPYLLGRPKESCFTYHNFEHVIRGCTLNAAKLELKSSQLKTCIGELCNKQCLPLENCVTCGSNSNDDPNCSINKIETCSIKYSSCYTCLNKNNVDMIRGCGPPPLNMNCQFCQEEFGCNTKPLQKCYKCNSEKELTCSGYPHSGTIETEICDTSDSQCVTFINQKNHTERGCLSTRSPCYNEACVPCTGQYCNNDIIPFNRIKCHQCRGTECLIKPEVGSEQPCRKFDKNDECFEFKLNTTNIVRGCKSDLKEFDECKKIGKDCRTCNIEGCNREIFSKKKPSLKCYKCNSMDPNCPWTQKFGDAEICNNVIDINATEYCFSYKSKNNGTILRGCSLDMNMCMKKNEECEICNETDCNKDVITPQYCIQEVVIDGKDQNKKLTKKKCAPNEQFLESEGCYVKRVNKTVTWGCAIDLSLIDLAECKKQVVDDQCLYCYGINCDQMKPPKGNTASQLAVLSSILIFISILVHSTF